MGATGQIGHVVVESLLQKGHQVKAIGRDQKKLDALKSKGAEIVSIKKFDDQELLTKAFKGADAVFTLIPPGYREENYGAFQDSVGEAIKTAIQKNAIPYLVNLSSMGAHLAEGVGPIKGLHRQEERLNALGNLNVVHLRPGYFMENLLQTIPMIQQTGTLKTPLAPELGVYMVSTDDIGVKAAEFLEQLNFKGHIIFDFAGPREKPLNLLEITKILGHSIDKPDLEYKKQSYEEAKKEMLNLGLSPTVADLLIEMYKAFNEGKCVFTQKITAEHRGKTTMEQFAQKFAKSYKQSEQKAVTT